MGGDQFLITRADKHVENTDLLAFLHVLCIKHKQRMADKD